MGDQYGTDTNGTGTYLYLATDQVYFCRLDDAQLTAHADGGGYGAGWQQPIVAEPVPLAEIPPLFFSEIMRDVDLFVGVASVGNDPAWADGGRQENERNAWNLHAFGDLSATAQTRRELLQRLVPKLKIADRCSFAEKFLVVRGDLQFGHDIKAIQKICQQVISAHELGCEISIVVGGGNIFRGVSKAAEGMERVTADYMGMLATCINGLALQSALEKHNLETRMLSAIPMNNVCEPYLKRRAARHLEKKRIVIFAAGTGNPFFTTDTAAVLRAVEMNCDVILKGTQVDGVYSADPKLDKNATRYEKLKYIDVIKQDLRVMDQTAITLAKDNKLPIIVFSIKEQNALQEVILGKGKFTIIN